MALYSVTVPSRALAGLRRHALAAAPAECCGALLGVRRNGVIEIRTPVAVVNEAAEPHRYHIDAATVLRLERRADANALSLVGFYHSHPSTAAVPSALDLELACPGYVHLIVQADTGVVRGWRLLDDRSGFAELSLAAPALAA